MSLHDDILDAYSHNLHDAQIGGHKDGITEDVAHDLGYTSHEELLEILHAADAAGSIVVHHAEVHEEDPQVYQFGHTIPVKRRPKRGRSYAGPVPGESEGEERPAYFDPPAAPLDETTNHTGHLAADLIRGAMTKRDVGSGASGKVYRTVMPVDQPMTYNQMVQRRRNRGLRDQTYDHSENM